jgi:hypothetical protein
MKLFFPQRSSAGSTTSRQHDSQGLHWVESPPFETTRVAEADWAVVCHMVLIYRLKTRVVIETTYRYLLG